MYGGKEPLVYKDVYLEKENQKNYEFNTKMGPPKIPKKRPRHWWLRGIIVCAYLLLTLLLHDVKADLEDNHYDLSNLDPLNSSFTGKYIVPNLYLYIFHKFPTIYILIFLTFLLLSHFFFLFFLRVPFFFCHSQYYISCHFHFFFLYFLSFNFVASMVSTFFFIFFILFSIFYCVFATREKLLKNQIKKNRKSHIQPFMCYLAMRKTNFYIYQCFIVYSQNRIKAQWITDMESMIVY